MAAPVILLVLGVCSLAYFGIYVVLVDFGNVFTWFWVGLGIVLLAAGAFLLHLHFQQKVLPPVLVRCVSVFSGAGILLFLVTEGIIIGYGKSSPMRNADYMIVLGARVRGTEVTANLARRLDTAYRYLQENTETTVILSGGQGRGEDISEAEAMAGYLEKKGIARSRIILEGRSVNTWQNIAYSREKMEGDSPSVVLVTNDFHVFRGVCIAKKQGLKKIYGLGAPTKWYTVPNMYVREALAVWKYALFGQI